MAKPYCVLLILTLVGSSLLGQLNNKQPLETAFAEVVKANLAKNATVLVSSPSRKLVWQHASGFANPLKRTKMTTNHQFRLASVTKMLTAVVILQLIEEGTLKLATRLKDVLQPEDFVDKTPVDGLLVLKEQSHGHQIRIKHLLSHRSGLADYWSALAPLIIEDFKRPGSNGYLTKQWTPKEIIHFFVKQRLPHQAIGKPGEKYHYSDTNFVLLGLIIEKLTNASLQQNFRRRIYSKVGMKDTYLEWYEPFDKTRLSHCFWSNGEVIINHSAIKGLSADWAGGGLVSTTKDLHAFLKGLFSMRFFRNRSTLEVMMNVASRADDQTSYGLGICRVKTKTGNEAWGHFGACGVSAFYFPSDDVMFILTVNNNLPKDGEHVDAINTFNDALRKTGFLIKK